MITNQRKFLFPLMLNLQLFAKSATVDGQTFEIDDSDGGAAMDADDELDDIEVDERDDDTGDDEDGADNDADDSDDGDDGDDAGSDDDAGDDDSDGDSGSDDGKENSKAGKEGAQKDNPTAKAVIAERRRLQAQMDELRKKADTADKLMKLVGVEDLDVLQQRLDAAEAQRISKASNGAITPEQAQAQIAQQRRLEAQEREIRKLKYGQEVAALKADPFFADIEDYREEYEEIAERTGQTLEEVYMAKRGRVRMKEFEREVEQRTLANKQKRQKSKVDTTSNGEQIKKEKYDLTPDQLAVAKAAVRMGTFKSVGEYAKMLKKK